MNLRSLNRSQQKFLFLFGIALVYTGLLVWRDFFQGPPAQWDEARFWRTSLTFSDSLIPSLTDLREYGELNTPLPFILFGMLEYLFGQGMFAGRLLNAVLSLAMVCIIGWPSRERQGRSLLCAIGLLICPYYLWLSGLLYTDIIACFWILLGIVGYARNRLLLAGIAFVLAIASRQYSIAFPAAIAAYEFVNAAVGAIRYRQFDLARQWRWLAPALAMLSLLAWVYLFKGLAPSEAIAKDFTPPVQQKAWAVNPGGAINFLAVVGAYIVIPEFILFRLSQPRQKLQELWQGRHNLKLVGALALALLAYVVIFPPLPNGIGPVNKIDDLLPYNILDVAWFFSLALLACIRFLRPNLMLLFVLFNAAIMFKAWPWDKYVLPLVVTFWYLKSIGLEDRFDFRTDWTETEPPLEDRQQAT